MATPNTGQISLSQITDEACQTGQRRFSPIAVHSLISTSPAFGTARNFGQYYGVRGNRVDWAGSQIVRNTLPFLGAGIRFDTTAIGRVETYLNGFGWTTSLTPTGWDLGQFSAAEARDYRISYTKVAGKNWTTLPPNNSLLGQSRVFETTPNNGGTYDITIYSIWRSCDSETRRVSLGADP